MVRTIKVAIAFYLVLIGWVLFRAPSMAAAFSMLVDMHYPAGLPSAGSEALAVATLTAIAFLLICFIDYVVIRKSPGLERRGWLLWPLLALGQGFSILLGETGHAFIYFQF